MPKNIFLNIDDDVSKAVLRVTKERSVDLTLVLPKNSWLLSSSVNLKLLKKQTDLLGKKIGIVTRDERGRKYAAANGIEVREPDYLNGKRLSMDLAPKARKIEADKMVFPQPPLEIPAAPQMQELPVAPAPSMAIPAPDQKTTAFADAAELKRAGQAPRIKLEKNELYQTKSKSSLKTRSLLRNSIFAAVVLFILIVVFVLPSAEITVYAVTQPIIRDFQISVDKNLSDPNQEQLAVPGKLIGDSQVLSMQFDATGQNNVGNHARGTVQIYNFTGQTLKLNATTTTLTVGTKSFHFVSDLSGIKSTRYFAGTKDVDPASLGPELQIVADQPGEDSDFPADTRLEIHNQVLGTAPQLLYAKAKSSIDNGTSRFQTEIGQADLDNARKALISNFLSSEKQKYAAQDLALLDSGSNLQLQNFSANQKVGDQVQKFTASAQGILNGLAFNPDVVRNMVEQRINLTLDSSKYLVTGANEKITEAFRTLDLNAGTGIVDVHFESIVGAKIDTAGISSEINGKNANQLKELLLSNPNIDSVDIKFAPFWVRSVPRFSGRVKVITKLRQ